MTSLTITEEIKNIKQKIVSALILVFAFVMIFSTVNVGLASNTANTTLAQNILAGSLDMTAPASLAWSNVTLTGSQQYSNSNLNGINVVDYRGGAGTGWNLTVYAENNLVAGSNNIDITARLNVAPGQVTSDKNAAAGSNFMMPNSSGSAAVLMNASASNGTGVSNITNTLFKLNIAANDTAGNYAATIVFTVSS